MKRFVFTIVWITAVSSDATGAELALPVSALTIVSSQTESHREAIRTIETGNPDWKWETGSFDLETVMAQNKIAGMSIAVIEDFEIAWTREYGYAHIAESQRVVPTTLFQAASITKSVTGMAVLSAVEQGRFGLDDSINDLLTSWRLPKNELTAKRAVTPRMLLSHTAGTTVSGFRGYWPDEELPSLIDVLNGTGTANTDAVLVDTEPHTQFRYSGGGYAVLQQTLEDLYAENYAEIVDRIVLAPIGMRDSTLGKVITPEDAPNAAHAFGGRMRAPWHVYVSASLWTTPTDLAKFAISLQKALRGDADGVLSPRMARTMVTPSELSDTYGLGISRHVADGNNIYFTHGGVNWGYVCRLIAHTEKGHGVVIMTNGTSRGNISQEIIRRVAATHGWNE